MSQWVLLWSRSQNALHIEQFDSMLSNNRSAYRDDLESDYLPIAVGTQHDVDACAAHCRATLLARREDCRRSYAEGRK
jgi:hypothetical protein